MSECFTLIQSKRDWGWYSLIGLLKSFLPGAAALMALSAIGTLIQLFIIDRLCKQKLLALTLFIPLTYIYFDFTLLRAGSALTIYFLGFFLLVNLQKFLGSSVLLSGYLFHSQGIFSIVILPFSWVAKNKYLSTAIIIGLVACIYLQWTPTAGQLRLLSIADSKPYWDQYHEGLFSKEKLFPIANLLIIGYLIFLLLANKTSLETDLIQRYSLASILLAIFLAWFFAPIHAAQTRLFDFYIAPLVFLAGNLKSNKYTLFATLGLVILLYIRIELIHNWMIG